MLQNVAPTRYYTVYLVTKLSKRNCLPAQHFATFLRAMEDALAAAVMESADGADGADGADAASSLLDMSNSAGAASQRRQNMKIVEFSI